jgi:CubicO group peptidase (beta-lactamase class C family)
MKNLILAVLIFCALPTTAQDDPITAFTTQIKNGDYGRVYSLLISHNEELVTEAYFRGYDGDDLFPVFSVTKSVTSAAIGIAIDQGEISGVEARLGDLLPDYEMNAIQQHITLEELLMMSAGFEWTEEYFVSEGQSDIIALAREDDWVEYVLDKEVIETPGSVFDYNSGISLILGKILEEATGQTAEAFVAENLFAPLEISEWEWETTGDGSSNTGWGLHLHPRDMLKFGELFLNQGRVGEEQVISEAWVMLSTQAQISVDDDFDYGYQWWRLTEAYLEGYATVLKDVYIAWGLGGQLVIVMPELDVVVVSTAANFLEGDEKVVEGVLEYVVPVFAS